VRTLLRATNWVGDVAMSLPALKALRASFPGDWITVLARPWVAGLYGLRREVNEVLVEDPSGAHKGALGRDRLVADLEARSFDRALLLPTSFETALVAFRAGIPERIGYRAEMRGPLLTRAVPLALSAGEHQVWKHLRLVEAGGAAIAGPPDASWSLSKSEREAGRVRLAACGWDGKPFVAAHVASFAHAAKRWDLARFARTFDALAALRGLGVVLLGSAGEKSVNAEAAALVTRASVLDLSGASSLPEVLGILSLATLFAGNDSGLAHLAAAVGTPTAVVFGATDPDATRPWDGPRGDGGAARVAVVRRRTPCAPCRFDVCPIDHQCMIAVEPDDLLAAVESLLAKENKSN
jgi:heptosyltransferase II